MEFMMELQYKSFKEDEAKIEASPYGFQHPYKLFSG